MKIAGKSFVTLLAGALAVSAASAPGPLSAAPSECEARAIRYCNSNWEPEGYSSRMECINELKEFECSGAGSIGFEGPRCWHYINGQWVQYGNYPIHC